MQIPVHESKMSLQPTAIDPSKAALLGKEVVDVSQGIEGIAEKMKDHQDWLDTNKAKLALYKQFNDNVTTAHTDQDLSTLKERLDDTNSTAISNAGNLIGSPDARNKFVSDAQLEAQVHNAHLQQIVWSRQMDEGKAAMMQVNDTIGDQYVHTADPGQRALLKQQMVDNINKAKESGYINASKAQRYFETVIPHLDVETARFDLGHSPEATIAELKKGDKGIYKDLDEAHRSSLIKMGELQVKRQGSIQKTVARETRENVEHDLHMKSLLGVDISQDIEKNLGRISRTAYRELTANGNSEVAPVCQTDNKECGNVINILMDKNKTDAEKRSALLSANTDGVLSRSDATRLYNMALVPDRGDFESLADRSKSSGEKDLDFIDHQEQKKAVVTKKQESLSAVWDFFKGWGIGRENSKEDATQAMLEFQQKSANTKPDGYMSVAKQVLNEKNIKDNPKIINNKKHGQLMIDAHGNKAMVYPDGSFDAL